MNTRTNVDEWRWRRNAIGSFGCKKKCAYHSISALRHGMSLMIRLIKGQTTDIGYPLSTSIKGVPFRASNRCLRTNIVIYTWLIFPTIWSSVSSFPHISNYCIIPMDNVHSNSNVTRWGDFCSCTLWICVVHNWIRCIWWSSLTMYKISETLNWFVNRHVNSKAI